MFSMMVSTCPFYYVLLEQFYTGEMNFPPINGVDEGSVVYVIIAILTGIYGCNEFWVESKFNVFGQEMQANHMMIWVLQKGLPLYSIVAMWNIYLKKHLDHFKKIWDMRYFIAQFVFWPISFFTYHLTMIYSPTKIWETNNRAVQVGHGL